MKSPGKTSIGEDSVRAESLPSSLIVVTIPRDHGFLSPSLREEVPDMAAIPRGSPLQGTARFRRAPMPPAGALAQAGKGLSRPFPGGRNPSLKPHELGLNVPWHLRLNGATLWTWSRLALAAASAAFA